MAGAEIRLVLLSVIIFSARAVENKTNLQNQIISLQGIVEKVVSDLGDLLQQHNVLEHKYNVLLDEFRLLRFNHVSSTKGVKIDEHASQNVRPKFAPRRSAIIQPSSSSSSSSSSSPVTALDQKGEKSDLEPQREANIPGLNGNNGQRGEKGDRGPKGDAGLPGFNGDDGYDGHKGEKGDLGIKGDAGIPGFNGDDGIDGPKGDKGEPGNSGMQGQKGNTGATGPAGHNGDTGATGPTGQKGNTGIPGPGGQNGNIGAPGTAGQKGDAGTPGPAGLKGVPGIPGPVGPTGLKGQKGLKGDECHMDAPFAFFAQTGQTINTVSNEIIAFPNIGVNIGASYDRSGVFTCKVTGIYVFTWSTEVNPNHTLTTLLVVNGSERGRLIVHGSVSNWNIGSTTVVLRLSVTDRVSILKDFFTTGTILGNSSLSGFFLYRV